MTFIKGDPKNCGIGISSNGDGCNGVLWFKSGKTYGNNNDEYPKIDMMGYPVPKMRISNL